MRALGKRGALRDLRILMRFNDHVGSDGDCGAHGNATRLRANHATLFDRLLTAMTGLHHLGVMVGRRHRHRASASRDERREQHRKGDQHTEERAWLHTAHMRRAGRFFNPIGDRLLIARTLRGRFRVHRGSGNRADRRHGSLRLDVRASGTCLPEPQAAGEVPPRAPGPVA